MSDHYWLTEPQPERIKPYFPQPDTTAMHIHSFMLAICIAATTIFWINQ